MLGLTNLSSKNLPNYTIVSNTIQPSNPRTNTIWVNTEEQMTDYIIDSAQPSNPTQGLVWIKTDAGAVCTFNAVRGKEIEISPVGVFQYIDNSFVEKAAQIYQNVWFDISYDIHWLIKNGKVVDSTKYLILNSGSSITIQEEQGEGDNKYYLLTVPAASGTYTTGQFDLSSFSTYSRIVFDGAAKGYYNASKYSPHLGHINAANSGSNNTTFYDSIKLTNATGNTNAYNPTRAKYIGIANLDSHPYVGFQIAGTSGYSGEIKIYNFYLTKESIDTYGNTWYKMES